MTQGFTYIMSNKHRTVYYTGVTSDIERRVLEHKSGVGSAFTKRYNVNELVYFEEHMYIGDAISREKTIKRWKREWKEDLIKSKNPEMIDLARVWYTQEEIEQARYLLRLEKT